MSSLPPEHPFSQVFRFNREVVGVVPPESPRPLPDSELLWLANALQEERDELMDTSFNTVSFHARAVAQVDALVDSAVFAIGGLVRLGLTAEQIQAVFSAVMDANFEKRAGVKPGRVGAADAVKPEGWVGPEARIWRILFDGE